MNNIALSSSVSSLLLLQKQMGVISNNISNANTAGYTVETEQVGEQVTGGVGSGVQDLGTTDSVNTFLQQQVNAANSTSTQASTYNTYYQSLQQVMGQITSSATGGNDIASQIATAQATISQLATTPQNTSLANQAVANIQDLTANFRATTQQIQKLRTQADQQITDTVNDINTQLNTISALNTQISTAIVTNQPTASLNDARSQALKSLSADMGVQSFVDSNGALQVLTSAGQPLITGNTVNEVSHSPVTITDTSTYAGGGINGIMVGNNDITGAITTGTLAALIQQRDTELPNAQNSLNYLAQQFSSGLNAASNLGSASPPPASLSSASPANYQLSDAVTTSDQVTNAQGQTGPVPIVRIALVDSSGQVQNYQDVSLAGAASVSDIVTDINAAFNPSGSGANVANIVGGQMVLTSPTTGLGIAVSTLQGSISPSSSGTVGAGTDFSSFFHLNDVVTGGNSAATIAINPAMLANSSLLPVGTLNSTVQTSLAGTAQQNGNPPFAGVGAGDGSAASNMSSALLADQTFTTGTATGITTYSSANAVPFAVQGSTPTTVGSFIINGGSTAVPVSISSGETLAQIAAAINASATSVGATGVSAQVVGSGIYQLQITTGSNSLSFSNVLGSPLSSLGLSSAPTGYLGASTTTFGGFATNLISDVAGRATTAQSNQTSTQTTLTALQSSLSNQSGVSVDQQTAQLTNLQNLYAASARVITTVNAMFSSLIGAVDGTGG